MALLTTAGLTSAIIPPHVAVFVQVVEKICLIFPLFVVETLQYNWQIIILILILFQYTLLIFLYQTTVTLRENTSTFIRLLKTINDCKCSGTKKYVNFVVLRINLL